MEDIIFPKIETRNVSLIFVYYACSSKPAMYVDDCINLLRTGYLNPPLLVDGFKSQRQSLILHVFI